MTEQIKLSEFSTLTEVGRRKRVDALFRASLHPTEQEVQDMTMEIDSQLCAFEQKHGISSLRMKELVDSGLIRADDEIHDWLGLLWKRNYIACAER